MYEVFCGKDMGLFATYEEATKVVLKEVKRLLLDNKLTYQILETCIWIVEKGSNNPIFFYEIRDNAIDKGWLTKQKNSV